MESGTTGTVGRQAEQLAFEFLLAHDLSPVARNFNTRGGEIDLVMLDGNCLAFIEVRFRATSDFSPPSETVDRHKQRKLVRTAALFVARNRRFANHRMRFDVLAIEGLQSPEFEWLQDAFRPEDSSF